MERTHKLHCTVSAFSLIETAIVLGIVGLVTGGIWVAAAQVSQNRNVSSMVADVVFMTNKLDHLYHDQPPTSTADITADAIAAGVVPKNLIVNGGIRTPWNTSMTIQTADGIAALNYGNELFGKPCRQFFAALYAGISVTQEFKTGQRILTINGNTVPVGSSPTTVMNYCANSADSSSGLLVAYSDAGGASASAIDLDTPILVTNPTM